MPAPLRQLLKQGLVGGHHHRPVEVVSGPPLSRLTQAPAQGGRVDQSSEGLGREAHMHSHVLGHAAAVGRGIQLAHRLDQGQPFAVAPCWGRQGGDQQAFLTVIEQGAIAIPIAEHHRQAGGHGLDRRLAEGLQDRVREREKHIGRRPTAAHQGLVVAVEQVDRHRGGMGANGGFEARPVALLIREPTGHQKVHRHTAALGRLLEGQQHRLGEGLVKPAEPTHPEHGHGIGAQAQLLAQTAAGFAVGGLGGEPGHIDPDRDDRQLGQAQLPGPGALGQIGPHVVEHGVHGCLHGWRRADHRIPGLQRCQQGAEHLVALGGHGKAKERAHQAVGPLLAGMAPEPGRRTQVGRAVQHKATLLRRQGVERGGQGKARSDCPWLGLL